MSYNIPTYVYDDQQGAVQLASGLSGLTVEQYRDTGFLMGHTRHDQDDVLGYYTFQFTHRKMLGTNLASVHLHCIPLVNPASDQNCYFSYAWTWKSPTGVEFPAISGWTTGNSTLIIGTADAFKGKIHSFTTNLSAPAGEGYSSILLFKVTRLGTDPLDTYNTAKAYGTGQANLAVVYIDIHFITDRSGSLQETSD